MHGKSPHKDRNARVREYSNTQTHTENQIISEVSFIYITQNRKSHFCLQGFLNLCKIIHSYHSTHANKNIE